MISSSGQASVPPGFRFHPTDEELLYYYLRKKVSYEAIDLDVIREVDLNKLEPWDLKDKCRIGTGPQNEWYFFSHKDKKYPTGTRTNRATTAGFWKATGRDKAIHHLINSKRIGMRKTLVFYTGRAPHGQKTDWIMHEYRLEDDTADVQEDGWVVCRVFKKKNHRGFQNEVGDQEEDHQQQHHQHQQQRHDHLQSLYEYNSCYSSMHLPQLFSPEANNVMVPSANTCSSFVPSTTTMTTISNTTNTNHLNSSVDDIECSHSLLRLTAVSGGGAHERIINNGDWSFLDKLLASHHHHHQHPSSSSSNLLDHVAVASSHRFPFPYLASDASDIFKFSK